MSRRKTPRDTHAVIPPRASPSAGEERLVISGLDDSWSTLTQEVELIDRLFGDEIAALFGDHENGQRHVRR